MAVVCARGSPCPHDGVSWLPWDQVRTRAEAAFLTACWGTPGKRLFLRASTASTLVAKGRRAALGVAAAALLLCLLVCYYTSSFVAYD